MKGFILVDDPVDPCQDHFFYYLENDKFERDGSRVMRFFWILQWFWDWTDTREFPLIQYPPLVPGQVDLLEELAVMVSVEVLEHRVLYPIGARRAPLVSPLDGRSQFPSSEVPFVGSSAVLLRVIDDSVWFRCGLGEIYISGLFEDLLCAIVRSQRNIRGRVPFLPLSDHGVIHGPHQFQGSVLVDRFAHTKPICPA